MDNLNFGFFVNNYKNKSFVKSFGENFLFHLRFLILRIRWNGRCKQILFYPDYPRRGYALYKIFKELGYSITNNLKQEFQIVIYWEDTTVRKPAAQMLSLSQNYRVVNLKSIDITKKTVDFYFKKTFGYEVSVEPKTYNGIIVKKSNINAVKNTVLINGPCEIEREENYVYQTLIDNTIDEKTVQDIRVVIIGDRIPLVYIKRKSIEIRFSHICSEVFIASANTFLSDKEIELILHFTKSMGLDYGEIDVLRNNRDERIYIVDVNNTPIGPPRDLPKKDQKLAIEILSKAFNKEFLETKNSKLE